MADPTARFSRRRMLKTGLFGFVAVAAGSVVLARRSTQLRHDTPSDLKLLTADEYAVLAAVAARLCPKGGNGAPGADALGIARKVDTLFAPAADDVTKGLKLALLSVENALGGALFGERIAPFTQLSGEAQDRALAALRDSRIGFRRTVYAALAGLVSALYWGDARTWPRIGYGGPPDVSALRLAYQDNLVDLDALRPREP